MQLAHDDGFRKPEDEPQADYVVWDASARDQSTYYLHGGLHLVDTGTEIQKLTWSNTGVALIDQIQAGLSVDRYPLFVSEGSSQDKLKRIKHSEYLGRCLRSLREIQGVLFVYGLSMAENDEHILRQIEHGKVSHIVIGLYGDPRSATNRVIVRRAEQLGAKRPPRRPLSVSFFNSESAGVWR